MCLCQKVTLGAEIWRDLLYHNILVSHTEIKYTYEILIKELLASIRL